ncbi:TG124 [Enterospora canceri]|uniref:TG124 n=1 Tax=Enterospora canceri TaxID=1081671 RepID=A0A1Y1S5S9_9MICR|nr:TG124 [Enterospora canceri]
MKKANWLQSECGGLYYRGLCELTKDELVALVYGQNNIRNVTKQAVKHKTVRKVAFQLSYDGKLYNGTQESRDGLSVTEVLRNALKKSDLFVDGNEMIFCGRTDRGVSAENAVVSLFTKSRLDLEPNDSHETEYYTFAGIEFKRYLFRDSQFEIGKEDYNEIPYTRILNNILPEHIRIKGWAPVPDYFSARHSCIERCYKYQYEIGRIRVKDGNLLDKFNHGAEIIRSLDDFYYFSKHDNPKANYNFRISELFFNTCGDHIVMEIRSYSFIHNMVRKIFSWIRRYAETGRLDYRDIEPAEAEHLVFCGATYRHKLAYISG